MNSLASWKSFTVNNVVKQDVCWVNLGNNVSSSAQEMQQIALHQLCHALCLDHSQNIPDCIYYLRRERNEHGLQPPEEEQHVSQFDSKSIMHFEKPLFVEDTFDARHFIFANEHLSVLDEQNLNILWPPYNSKQGMRGWFHCNREGVIDTSLTGTRANSSSCNQISSIVCT